MPAGAFGVQREPLAGRAPLVAWEPEDRAAAERPSELARRAGRAPDRLPDDDCAGLRSREGVAGRLKCGRAEALLPLAAGLRAGVVRGAWGSADLSCSTNFWEEAEAGLGVSNSGVSSWWSHERDKYAEEETDELE